MNLNLPDQAIYYGSYKRNGIMGEITMVFKIELNKVMRYNGEIIAADIIQPILIVIAKSRDVRRGRRLREGSLPT